MSSGRDETWIDRKKKRKKIEVIQLKENRVTGNEKNNEINN